MVCHGYPVTRSCQVWLERYSIVRCSNLSNRNLFVCLFKDVPITGFCGSGAYTANGLDSAAVGRLWGSVERLFVESMVRE